MNNHNVSLFRIVADILILTLIFVCNATITLAAGTATVAATVTLQNVSVSVADGSISYGTLATNVTKTTLSGGLNDQQTATNSGNITEDLNIKGQNSVSWTLSGTAGADQYVHKFCIATCGTEGTPGAGFTALTTSYAALGTSIAASGTAAFDLLINTPTSSSVFTSQSVDVTVQAVAS